MTIPLSVIIMMQNSQVEEESSGMKLLILHSITNQQYLQTPQVNR